MKISWNFFAGNKRKFNWDNYLKYMHGQVEELVRDYGMLDIMWFDYSFDDYSGEKWKVAELPWMKTWWGNTEPGNLFINTGSSPEKPLKYDTVVRIEIK